MATSTIKDNLKHEIDSLNSNVKATLKTWTPKLYDYQTYLRDLPNGYYLQIGRFVIASVNTNAADLSGISTMMQIRNLPMDFAYGGNVYIANLSDQGASRTIQAGESFLIRPNLISSAMSTPASPGWVSMLIIGVKYSI